MQTTEQSTGSTPLLKTSIIVLLLFETCALFVRSYAELELENDGVTHLVAKDLSWLLVPLILGTLMWPILRQHWHSLIALLHFRHLTLRLVLVSVLLGLTLHLAYWGGLIAKAGFLLFTVPAPDATVGPVFTFYCPSLAVLGLTTLVSVFLTPLVEEVINRGFVLHTLLPRGRSTAVVVSAIFFGLYHNPQMIAPAIIIGLFLALQFLNVRTLWAPVITHGTYNGLNIVDWVCLHGMWNPVAATSVTIAVGSLALALMVVALILAGILTRKNWYLGESEHGAAPRPADTSD